MQRQRYGLSFFIMFLVVTWRFLRGFHAGYSASVAPLNRGHRRKVPVGNPFEWFDQGLKDLGQYDWGPALLFGGLILFTLAGIGIWGWYQVHGTKTVEGEGGPGDAPAEEADGGWIELFKDPLVLGSCGVALFVLLFTGGGGPPPPPAHAALPSYVPTVPPTYRPPPPASLTVRTVPTVVRSQPVPEPEPGPEPEPPREGLDPRDRAKVRRYLRSNDPTEVSEALELGIAGEIDIKARSVFKILQGTRDEGVAETAVRLLERIGSKSALRYLRNHASRGTYGRKAAREAYERLRKLR